MVREQIKGILSSDYDLLESVLDDLGFTNIKEYGAYYRFGFDFNSNPTAIRLYKGSLNFKNYKHTENQGDIFSLVKYKLGCSFDESLAYLMGKCNITDEQVVIKSPVKLPFEGIFKKVKCNSLYEECNTYSEEILESLKPTYSELFLQDGISLEAQDFFDIRYDSSQDRICFPIYTKNGLVGVLGRYNSRYVEDYIPKYLPLHRYEKSKVVFGALENLKYIKNNSLLVVESEKSVMKAYSYGFRNVVALGGNSVSDYQKLIIHSTFPKEIILALDEGMSLQHIQIQLDKLFTFNVLFKATKIGYLDNINLPSKSCVFDLELEQCKNYIKENIKWQKEI